LPHSGAAGYLGSEGSGIRLNLRQHLPVEDAVPQVSLGSQASVAADEFQQAQEKGNSLGVIGTAGEKSQSEGTNATGREIISRLLTTGIAAVGPHAASASGRIARLCPVVDGETEGPGPAGGTKDLAGRAEATFGQRLCFAGRAEVAFASVLATLSSPLAVGFSIQPTATVLASRVACPATQPPDEGLVPPAEAAGQSRSLHVAGFLRGVCRP